MATKKMLKRFDGRLEDASGFSESELKAMVERGEIQEVIAFSDDSLSAGDAKIVFTQGDDVLFETVKENGKTWDKKFMLLIYGEKDMSLTGAYSGAELGMTIKSLLMQMSEAAEVSVLDIVMSLLSSSGLGLDEDDTEPDRDAVVGQNVH